MRYKSNLPNEVRMEVTAFVLTPDQLDALVAQLGPEWKMTIAPGEEFDSPGPLNHPHLEPLDAEAKTHATRVAEQDARLLAENRLRYGYSPGELPAPVVAHLEGVSVASAEDAAALEGPVTAPVKKVKE